jgi:hypothetical protein
MNDISAGIQKRRLFFCLNTFRYNFQVHVFGDGQDCLDQCGITFIDGCILDKTAVNFQFVNRQPLEIGQ